MFGDRSTSHVLDFALLQAGENAAKIGSAVYVQQNRAPAPAAAAGMDLEQFRHMLQNLGVPNDHHVATQFAVLDKDRDGMITLAEFQGFATQLQAERQGAGGQARLSPFPFSPIHPQFPCTCSSSRGCLGRLSMSVNLACVYTVHTARLSTLRFLRSPRRRLIRWCWRTCWPSTSAWRSCRPRTSSSSRRCDNWAFESAFRIMHECWVELPCCL